MNAEATVAELRAKAGRLPAEGSDVVRQARKRALEAVETVAAAVGVDPTLVEMDRCLRDIDLLAEILRQLKPLARQAETELERRALASSLSLDSVDRINPRRTNLDAPDELEALSRHSIEVADRIRASALPDWNTPKRIRERSERLLPSQWTLEEIADRLRQAVKASLDLPYPAEEAVRLAALADQIATPLASEERDVSDTDAVRPRTGQIAHPDGSETPVMFEQDADDLTLFHAVTLEGKAATYRAGDRLYVDVIGPGQSVVVDGAGS